MRRYPVPFGTLFLDNPIKPKANLLQDLYKVELSPSGCNLRLHEEALSMAWINFVIACEGNS